MTLTPITDNPGLHGLRGQQGDRMVEVLRVDSCTGEWMVYAKIGRQVVKAQSQDPKTKAACIRWAQDFLGCKFTPETWQVPSPKPIEMSA